MANINSAKKVTVCSIKAVQALFDNPISRSTACNYIHQCRDALAKKKHHMLTIDEFVEYFDIK